MVNFCCVVGCSNRSNRDSDVSFFCIPAVLKHQGDHAGKLSKQRREQWLANINREGWSASKSTRVCSAHFISGKPAYLHDTSNPDWAPTQNMGYSQYETQKASNRRTCKRLAHRKRKADDVATASLLLELHRHCPYVDNLEHHEQSTDPAGVGIQTVLSLADISSLEERIQQLVRDNIALRAEVLELREKNKRVGRKKIPKMVMPS